MVLRLLCAFAWLMLLALPWVQSAIELGMSQRFGYLLLFNLAW
ncbi:hypothetical protein [Pantoea alhagi]|nr:hypothetical protein [Pantoea alhagi]